MSDSFCLHEFPCFYTFKVFGRNSEMFADRVRRVIARTLGDVPLDSVKVRVSSRGRYQSVTVCVGVTSRQQLERVYEDLRLEEDVLFYL